MRMFEQESTNTNPTIKLHYVVYGKQPLQYYQVLCWVPFILTKYMILSAAHSKTILYSTDAKFFFLVIQM